VKVQNNTLDENVFIEQAEYIAEAEMIRWVQSHPSEKIFLRKLASAGAKLVVGPRGSGKTTLLLKSYHDLRQLRDNAFPVYVNFKTSLKLEPIYKTNVNANYWFTQWLILRVYRSIYDTLSAVKNDGIKLPIAKNTLSKMITDLEKGDISSAERMRETLSIERLRDDIFDLLEELDLSRAVLLLDDAAHAFSFAQQRAFFDFFREVKARHIAPKAAIYPGVTSFSATFQAGHDAEELDVWLKPDDANYLPFMRELVQKRLPTDLFKHVEDNRTAFELVCYCAFGIPRALLNMLHDTISGEDDSEPSFSTRTAQQAVRQSIAATTQVYESLKLKIPLYSNFIETGSAILSAAGDFIREYNRGKRPDRQSVSLAINTPLTTELAKTFGFLEYAGLVAPRRKVSRGEKGTFQLYDIHYAYLVSHNAIVPSRSLAAATIVEALGTRNAHEFTRVNSARLLGDTPGQNAFALMLPPCQVCNTPRLNEEARFCHHCGAPLKNISIFEQLVSQNIHVLPLTDRRIQSIENSSRIRTIKDVLLDHDHQQLRSVPQVGPYWAKRIMSYAEEYIA
jgi:hypothetical protein